MEDWYTRGEERVQISKSLADGGILPENCWQQLTQDLGRPG